MADPTPIPIPSGHVIMTTRGDVRAETVQAWSDARSFAEAQGLHVRWAMCHGALPEKARNEAVRDMLRDANASWLLQIDADMVWAPDAVLRMLHTAYVEASHAHVVGAWCPLRGELALPTIDTGTGTWESVFPGSGILDVIRTGAAFHLTKRVVYENLRDPWYRLRVPSRPLDFLLEVDNWARIKFDGRNPLRDVGDIWERLEKCARDDPSVAAEQFTPVEVGEDSGFCDRVRAAGFRIVVNTDIEIGHVDMRVLRGADHKKAIDDRERAQRALCGIGT